ncbi:MAG TPA: FmdB family zinc ribbon protein [Acidimicrobiales bacterium]|nr:FmdB family zinc ribbon protein [Acidimicrobiales bacterium]
MPTYEYRCRDCGEDLEVYQSFTEDALTECPNCGGSLRKLFGNVGISFKGTGFYKNDHGSRASSGDANGAADSKTDTKADTKSETKTDAKSESKSESKPAAKPASAPAPSTA